MRRLNFVFPIFLLCVVSTFAFAQNTVNERFELPGHGHIEFQVPKSWRSKLNQPPGSLPPTIIFTSVSGQSFQVLVTLIFSIGEDKSIPTLDEVRGIVAHSAVQVEPQAIEEKIQIEELRGAYSQGFYFSATDKAPKLGEYKFITQGMFLVGDLAPTFTVLTNSGDEQVIEESLKMLQGTKHVKFSP